MVILNNDWDKYLNDEFNKSYFYKLNKFLDYEYDNFIIYPERNNIFNALRFTPLSEIKVVILGQDPYHTPDQANGLSFSVPDNIKIPHSLMNIYKEIESELCITMPRNYGCLKSWSEQGVLLLNNILTVRKKAPNSHKECGWHIFTDKIISLVNEKSSPCVFLLWGNQAKQKENLINKDKHLVLCSTHPSPLSAYQGFIGCGHFEKTNEFLEKNNIKPINWQIKKI
ncbi:MAG: uracil-DNA glycosylase [Oscillospiraceae bacterium]